MDVVSAELNRNNEGKGWFYGDSITFIDIYVATFMRAFDETMKLMKWSDRYEKDDKYELLREHRKRFEATEIYQKFAKSVGESFWESDTKLGRKKLEKTYANHICVKLLMSTFC